MFLKIKKLHLCLFFLFLLLVCLALFAYSTCSFTSNNNINTVGALNYEANLQQDLEDLDALIADWKVAKHYDFKMARQFYKENFVPLNAANPKIDSLSDMKVSQALFYTVVALVVILNKVASANSYSDVDEAIHALFVYDCVVFGEVLSQIKQNNEGFYGAYCWDFPEQEEKNDHHLYHNPGAEKSYSDDQVDFWVKVETGLTVLMSTVGLAALSPNILHGTPFQSGFALFTVGSQLIALLLTYIMFKNNKIDLNKVESESNIEATVITKLNTEYDSSISEQLMSFFFDYY